MRILPALALAAIAAAVALASGPASAQEACPIERAVYEAKDAPEYRMEFKADPSIHNMLGLMAQVGRDNGPVEAQMIFTAGNRSPWTATPGGAVLALNSDFSAAGLPRAGGEAPYAIILGDLWGAAPDGLPHSAWILSECR